MMFQLSGFYCKGSWDPVTFRVPLEGAIIGFPLIKGFLLKGSMDDSNL